MEFKISICGVVIRIEHSYGYIRSLCREYEVDDTEPYDFSVSTTEVAIEAEKRICKESYTDGVYESTCLHREIVKRLLQYGIILMHSAVIAVDDQVYVFMAKSGVGKSTHIRLWREVFGERARIVNGDKPFFSFVGDTFTAHGSPWKGKEGYGEPISLPVAAICFLERGEINVIRPANSSEAVQRIFHQLLLPENAAELTDFMSMLDRILKTVPLYILQCNMDKEAALVAYRGMRKEN